MGFNSLRPLLRIRSKEGSPLSSAQNQKKGIQNAIDALFSERTTGCFVNSPFC